MPRACVCDYIGIHSPCPVPATPCLPRGRFFSFNSLTFAFVIKVHHRLHRF